MLQRRTGTSETSRKGTFGTAWSSEYCLGIDKKIQIDYVNSGALGTAHILRSNLSGVYLRQSIHI